MKLISVHLSGMLEGVIWMPSVVCEKEFDITFSTDEKNPWTRYWDNYLHHNKLRSALLHVTDDGDFQSCSIAYCYLTARWLDERGRIIEMTNEINPAAKDIADLFTH